MNNSQLYDLARVIKENCWDTRYCADCIFYDFNGDKICKIGVPANWNIKINNKVVKKDGEKK